VLALDPSINKCENGSSIGSQYEKILFAEEIGSVTRPAGNSLTQLLNAARAGDEAASDQLLPLVYDELRQLARREMERETPGQTLQPTALVHEGYLRLAGDENACWNGRAHYYSAAAIAMRRILIERARKRQSLKGGGGHTRLSLAEIVEPIEEEPAPDVLLALDVALEKLAQLDTRLSRIVMLRSFAGLTIEQTAKTLELSPATVKRDWRFAQAWLLDEMSDDD
jgi:RNA polymerase sigma factor (TIGR02999 family)